MNGGRSGFPHCSRAAQSLGAIIHRWRDVPIIVRLDVMLARRKTTSRNLDVRIGIAEQDLTLLKSRKVRGVRFNTLEAICSELDCQTGDPFDHQSDSEDPWRSARLTSAHDGRLRGIPARRAIALLSQAPLHGRGFSLSEKCL